MPQPRIAIATAVFLLCLSGCQSGRAPAPPPASPSIAADSAGAPPIAPTASPAPIALTIECVVFYRSRPFIHPEENALITLSEEQTTVEKRYGEFVFYAVYWPGVQAYEQRSLQVRVTLQGAKHPIHTAQFDLPKATPIANQLGNAQLGDVGFTGWINAYDPSSGAEFDYWCAARQ